LTFFIKLKRTIEGAARDQVTCSARIKLGVQGRIVLGRRTWCKNQLNTRMLCFKCRNDFVLPNGQIIVAPTFNS